MIKYKNRKVITDQDWDELVQKTYNKPYTFQQQYGCQERGTFTITIPSKETEDDELPEIIPEVVNGEKMGVKFSSWIARDPKQKIKGSRAENDWDTILWWKRNFYPDIQMVANDLYSKGLIESGEYDIKIDW